MGSQTPAAGTAIVGGPEVVVALSLEGFSMLVWLAVILLVAWLLGWGVFHVAGGLIHLLLVIALVVFLINFITGRRTV
jgi:predicted membrane metal-binding protein